MSLSSIRPYIREGTFVFTLTSNGYKYFTLNLLEHLKRVGVPWKLCILCADRGAYDFFRGQNVPTVRVPNPIDTGSNISPFGTVNFQKLNRMKLDLLAEFCAYPEIQHGIYMDGDIAVYNDLVPDVVSRLTEVPIMFQCDENGIDDCIGARCICPHACTGFIGWKYGISPSLFKVVPGTLAAWRAQPEDQVFVNTRLREEGTAFKTFPRDLYPNGKFSSLYRADSPNKKVGMILHYNHLVGMDKKRRMLQNRDWLLEMV